MYTKRVTRGGIMIQLDGGRCDSGRYWYSIASFLGKGTLASPYKWFKTIAGTKDTEQQVWNFFDYVTG